MAWKKQQEVVTASPKNEILVTKKKGSRFELWLSWLAIIVSCATLIISWLQTDNAIQISEEANELSKENAISIGRQFFSVNRPIIKIKPGSFGINQLNYTATRLPDSLQNTVVFDFENIGNLLVQNFHLKQARCRAYFKSQGIGFDNQTFETLNHDDKLTTIDILPKDGLAKKIDFKLKIPNNLINEIYRDNFVNLMLNIEVYAQYYNQDDDSTMYVSNYTFAISSNFVSTLYQKYL